MNTEQAIAICEGWLSYLNKQRKQAEEMQGLAVRPREGQTEKAIVYDAANLEKAVQYLVASAKGIFG